MSNDVTKTEERIAYLEKTIEELSDVTFKQGQEIAQLTARIKLLLQREAERELDQGGSIPLADQKPPHW